MIDRVAQVESLTPLLLASTGLLCRRPRGRRASNRAFGAREI